MLNIISEWPGVIDSLPCRRENKEHHGGEEAGAERQIGEHLVHVLARVGEEAALHGDGAERHRQEHHGREHGVHVVHPPYPQPAEVLEHLPPSLGVALVVVAGVVEHEEALDRGDAVVELAVTADEAVGEGEEDAGEEAEVEQRGGEVPVGGEARAPVGEGRGQRLERQRGARRQQLREVGHARQRLVHGRRRRVSFSYRCHRGRLLQLPRRGVTAAAERARRRRALAYHV